MIWNKAAKKVYLKYNKMYLMIFLKERKKIEERIMG